MGFLLYKDLVIERLLSEVKGDEFVALLVEELESGEVDLVEILLEVSHLFEVTLFPILLHQIQNTQKQQIALMVQELIHTVQKRQRNIRNGEVLLHHPVLLEDLLDFLFKGDVITLHP